jgi:hypothetical protein
MSSLKLPALDPNAVREVRGSNYLEPFKSTMGDRAKQRLGEACGLTKFRRESGGRVRRAGNQRQRASVWAILHDSRIREETGDPGAVRLQTHSS